mmetsp:Transcript_123872/g.246512  ORF Transcript_123872/g.246512 Transcript_123872/m.246512 type:complete len:340 (-) Transcript_123872:70-1089(-)
MFDDDLLEAAFDAVDEEVEVLPSAPPADEPTWLSFFRSRVSPEDVASQWVLDMCPEEVEKAKQDPQAARARLRQRIVEANCADAADGWSYTGAVLRAADAALGIVHQKAEPAFHAKPSSFATGCIDMMLGEKPFRMKRIVEGDGSPGNLAIWWSDFESANQAENLAKYCGVNCRLNCAAELVDKFAGSTLVTRHMPMHDTFSDEDDVIATWTDQLRGALEALRELRKEGAVVNVNCRMGKNRSGAVVAAWLCTECGWSLDQAVEHLRQMNPLALANPHLAEALRMVLQAENTIPLNRAPDGGGWICLSPPGTPRDGAAANTGSQFQDLAAEAAAKLSND